MKLITENPLPTHQFVHVFIQQNGSSLKIYIDGIEQNAASGSINAGLWFDGLDIDHWYISGSGNSYFSGWLDELYLASGTLSANAINALSQAADPLVRFDFEDNNSGDTVVSQGTNNSNAIYPLPEWLFQPTILKKDNRVCISTVPMTVISPVIAATSCPLPPAVSLSG